MSNAAINDLIDQYQRTFRMLTEEIERFNDQQWLNGLDYFLTPVNVAMHILDCLDYYFSGKTGDEYVWGYRFGGDWWELTKDRLPGKTAVLEYAGEVQKRIMAEFETLQDEDLSRPVEIEDGSGATRLGHYLYALRHTIHHHGELSVLSVYNGNQGGSWE